MSLVLAQPVLYTVKWDFSPFPSWHVQFVSKSQKIHRLEGGTCFEVSLISDPS